MTLESFEKTLAEEARRREDNRHEHSRKHRDHKRHRHHHGHHRDRDHDHDHDHRRHRRSDLGGDDDRHRHKRRRRSDVDEDRGEDNSEDNATRNSARDGEVLSPSSSPEAGRPALRRDDWMEAPPSGIEYIERRQKSPPARQSISSTKESSLKIHENELNKELLGNHGKDPVRDEPDEASSDNHEVDYVIGDSGSNWRMMKLKSVYRKAKESGQAVDTVASQQYGDLRLFDDAREEEAELERREMYGPGSERKEKPVGDLYQERQKTSIPLQPASEAIHHPQNDAEQDLPESTEATAQVDQTTLNRLRAQAMKAKLRGASDADALEKEYQAAAESFAKQEGPRAVVLGAMENRNLAGSRRGEVKDVETRRGRERGLVEENDDMSVEDMIREERRTRGQTGGEGRRFAERIAKDQKFTNDLDYIDENADKLARRVQKSEINLRNVAISDFQKINRILDKCPLCHREDTQSPPIAPIVSLGTRVYLTLEPEPELAKWSACIVPIEHRTNLLECDDDEWEEIRNFMKSLTRMFHERDRLPVFHENAARPHRHPHAVLHCTPLPASVQPASPGYFRQAILESAPEWAQHRKIIDTLKIAKEGRVPARAAFRSSLVKQMPYFHVWFDVDGGYGHVVEDADRWPRGDQFAREVLGGILDVDRLTIRKEGRWVTGDSRLKGFRDHWDKWDWTKALVGTRAG